MSRISTFCRSLVISFVFLFSLGSVSLASAAAAPQVRNGPAGGSVPSAAAGPAARPLFYTGAKTGGEFLSSAQTGMPATERYAPMYNSPSVAWNTFLGGGGGNEEAKGIAVDSAGNVYVTGKSASSWSDHPKRAYTGGQDAYAAKFDASGNLVWNTFLGGDADDFGWGIGVDAAGNVYVSGDTDGSWGNNIVRAYTGGSDAFIAKLNPNGVLQWNTFLGGDWNDGSQALAVDAAGNAYTAGDSDLGWGSPVLPYGGGKDAYAVKVNSGGGLEWSTFLGATGYEAAYDVTLGGDGNLYVSGGSDDDWGSPAQSHTGSQDAFAAELDPADGSLTWNTFLGGTDIDWGGGIAADSSGTVYVTGGSFVSWGAPIQPFSGGEMDSYVARLDTYGNLNWNTFFGGSGSGRDAGEKVVVDGGGNVYVSGESTDTWGSPARAHGGGDDAYIAVLNASGSLQWNTFLGGSGEDRNRGVAIDADGDVFINGDSTAAWSGGATVRPFGGSGRNAFAAKIDHASHLPAWNSFLGGGGSDDEAKGMAVDAAGNVYVTGKSVSSWGGTATVEAFHASGSDAYAAKINPDGSLAWVSFLGGTGDDFGWGIGVDAAGNVYVSGDSSAAWGSPVRGYTGSQDAFIAKLNPSGALQWNTFLGGDWNDGSQALAVDASGNVYIGGWSDLGWGDAPVRGYTAGSDSFAAMVDSDGVLQWNTFLGGNGGEGIYDVALGRDGNLYVSGGSGESWGSPVQDYNGGGYDAFAAEIDPATGALAWHTFLGGVDVDWSGGIAADGGGNVYVSGGSFTGWGSSPVRAYSAGIDAFVAKLDTAGGLVWNTFLGGSEEDTGDKIVTGPDGNVYLAGHSTASWGVPLRRYSAGSDVYAAELNPDGDLLKNTFLGGSGEDRNRGTALLESGIVYVCGDSTAAWGTPVRGFTSGRNAFAVKVDLSLASDAVPYIKASPTEDWVHAHDWPTGAALTLYVDDDLDGLGDVDYTAYATAEQSPWNPADPIDTHAVFELSGDFDIGNGDVLTVTDGTTSLEYTVVDLTQLRWFIGLGNGTTPEQILVEQEVADNFNISHSGLELVIDVHEKGSAVADLQAQIDSGNGPDIIGPVGWWGSNSFQGQWLDLDPLITLSGFDTGVFNPELMAMYNTADGQVGLPFLVYPSAVFYNPALFDAAGLNYPPAHYGEQYEMPDHTLVDWDWDTIQSVSRLMTLDSSGRNATEPGFDQTSIIQYGYTWQYQNNPNYWGSFWGSGSMLAGGTPGSYTAHVPDPWRAAWEWTFDGIWGDQPWIPNGTVIESPEFGGGNPFNTGRVAMTDQPIWYTCCVSGLSEFQLGAMPSYNGTVAGRIDADTFRIWNGSPNQDGAFEALSYLVTTGVDKLIVGSADMPAAYGGQPALTAAQTAWRDAIQAQFPFVTDDSWDVVMAGLDYADIPSAEGYVPNYVDAWNRGNDFAWQVRYNGGISMDNEIACYLSDLERIFNGLPAMGCAYFQVRPNIDQVEAFLWPLGSTVHLEIDDPATPASPDYSGDQTVGLAPWDANQTYASFNLDGVFDVQAGFTATVSGSGIIKVLLVTNHAFTDIDEDTDTVTGVSVPGARVDIWVCGQIDCPANRHVYADGSGVWTADFSVVGVEGDEQTTYDIVPGTWVDSNQRDADNDSTMWGETVPNPRIEASPNGRWINAREWPLGTSLALTVDDPGTPDPADFTDTATVEHNPGNPGDPNDIGAFFDWPSIGLETGFVVTVDGGGVTKVLTISPLQVTAADPSTDLVTGSTTPGVQVHVCANVPGWCVTRWVTADGSGNWTADYSVAGVPPDDVDTVDLQPGNNGWSSQADADGDVTWIDWYIPNPRIEASPNSHWITAREWPIDTLLTLEIDDPGTPDPIDYTDDAIVEHNPYNPGDPNDIGAFFDWPEALGLQVNFVLTVTGGGTTKVLIISPLNVTSANPQTDTVTGVGFPGNQAQVCANIPGRCITRWVTANGGGNWTADYSVAGVPPDDIDTVDLRPGDNGWVAETDADGDRTWIDWNVYSLSLADPYIKADPVQDWVHAHDWPAGAVIALLIDDATSGPGVDYTDSATVAQSPWNPADPNDTHVVFDLSGVFDLENGDLITVTDGTTSRDYTVVDLTQVRWFIGWGTGADPSQIIVEQEVADNFNISHSGLELVLEVHDVGSAQADLAAEIAADNGPDIVGPTGWGAASYFHGDWMNLAPLIASAGFDTGVFDANLVAMYQTDEGQVGLPFVVYPSAVFYNPVLFDAAGLNYPPAAYGVQYEMPDSTMVDWNWDTVALVAKLLTLDSAGRNATEPGFDKNSIVQYGYTWQYENHPNYYGSFWGGGSMLADGGSPGSYTAQVPDPWRAAWEWTYEGIWGDQPWMANAGVEGSPDYQGGNPFDSGRVAMTDQPMWYTCCTWDLTEFQFGAMPTHNGEVNGRMDADTFRIWNGTPNAEEAFEALAYLVTAGVDKLIVGSDDMAAAYGGLPALTSERGARLDDLKEQFPFITDASWNVMMAGLDYADIPNAESYVPNYSPAWNRGYGFLDLLRNNDGVNLDYAIECYRADLEALFNGEPAPGCIALPDSFSKTAPSDAGSVGISPTLEWGASGGADSYEYCFDTTDDDSCDGTWTSAGTDTSAGLSSLASETTYYWQVRAVNAAGNTEADGGTWWSFTTLPALPGAFGKATPADAASTTASPTLSWGASGDADEYEYCYDTSDNDTCDTLWISTGTSTSAGLSGLSNTVTYYWQVRAVNAAGGTEADGGAWWRFTVKVQTFADVPVTYWAWSYIERLFSAGITGGCGTSPLRYCPSSTVTRAQMAIFLERGMNGSSYTPPGATGTIFGDVPISYWAAAWIEKLYADGITGGCGGGNYCPDQAVTRAQMAIFLLRAEHGSTYTPPAATGTVFGDVPISHWAGAWIEQLSAEGITGGCGGGNFCPNQAVTRAEMAIFLVRTFNLP